MSKNRIERAFEEAQRQNFVRESEKHLVDFDRPLSIGHGQTISQPYTVRKMLEWLDAQPNDKVLDVGSGSGWTSALLSHIVGPKGQVYAVERIPELVKFGRENCKKIGIENAKFYEAGEEFGLPEEAPFDRILVSASADELPKDLLKQLKIGGKLVVPVKNSVLEITINNNSSFETVEHPGFIFVPLLPK